MVAKGKNFIIITNGNDYNLQNTILDEVLKWKKLMWRVLIDEWKVPILKLRKELWKLLKRVKQRKSKSQKVPKKVGFLDEERMFSLLVTSLFLFSPLHLTYAQVDDQAQEE